MRSIPQIRYTSYTGQMNALENFAFLPTSMYNVTEDGTPEIAQWNYRVLCHPLARDLPTSMLKLQVPVKTNTMLALIFEMCFRMCRPVPYKADSQV